MRIIQCTDKDVVRLAAMNKRLIEDEGSNNPMTIEELQVRMAGFIAGEYDAFLFETEENVVGYALVKRVCSPLYLRQFFIEREYRRRHYGKEAFERLLKHLNVDTIDIDVLPWNETGLKFWRDLGFSETCISMRYNKK